MQALSPDGRCKTFDAGADGYGRGEGFAVVYIGLGSHLHAPIATLQVRMLPLFLYCVQSLTYMHAVQACRVGRLARPSSCA